VGYIKGKSAIYLSRTFAERKKNFVGQHFWARGFYVSTVGRDEDGDSRVHQDAGTRRYATGSVGAVEIGGHRTVAPSRGAALAAP